MRGLQATPVGSSISMRNHSSVRRFPHGAGRRPMSLTLPLFALATGAFGIGTTEFAPMGLLPVIAADLHISIPTAGLLVTGYALGVVVGAPLLALPTERVPRKWLLLGLMALFTLGNLLSALSPNYA